MNIAIYSRKSVYTSSGDSIENQIDLCKDYYSRMINDSSINFVIYEDEGFSGKNIKRPQFQKLLKDIKSKKIQVLLCYRLDRISRNVADFSSTLELLQKYNVDFISIKEQFDTSTPMGRAMIHIASVFAQLERETIAERIRDNMIELSKTGRWLGGIPPLGYDAIRENYLDEDLKEKSLSKLVINEKELKYVKLIYDKYLELKSLNKVSIFCMENNISGKLGGSIERSGLGVILQNPVYVKSTAEILAYLKTNGFSIFGKANGNGIFRYSQDTSEKIATVSNHPGIIEANKWLKVQDLLNSNLNPKLNSSVSNTALLTRLIKCGKCGANMIVKYGNKYKSDKRAFYYVCSNKIKSSGLKCNSKNIKGDLTEELIINSITDYNKNQLLQELKIILNNYKENLSEDNKLNHKNIDTLEGKIKRLVEKLSLTDDIEISKILLSQIKEHKEEVKKIQFELNQKLKEDDENDVISYSKKESNLYNLDNFNNLIKEATIDEKRQLLFSIIEKIIWDEENQNLNIIYKKEKGNE
ncbi:recombinase family protein [Clostridium tertium]|uniref:DNA-invertase hin n=1 Tax=Clostridium tertium TaxID=1559 RepID=A0A6N2Y6G1_9CLOT